MPEETETVTGTPAQEQSTETHQTETTHTDKVDDQNGQSEVQVSSEVDSQPTVEACILKANIPPEPQKETIPEQDVSSPKTATDNQAFFGNARPKSPEVMATEAFLLNEQGSVEREISQPQPQPTVVSSISTEPVHKQMQETITSEPVKISDAEPLVKVEPRTPAYSETSESGVPASEEVQDSEPPKQIVEEPLIDTAPVVIENYTTVNGDVPEEASKPKETLTTTIVLDSTPQCQLTNGQSNGECKLEPKKVPEPESQAAERGQVLIESIANELKAEDYKLPDVVEVKKHFEYVQPAHNDTSAAPPKKGALSTRIDTPSIKKAYEDVRYDGSETQWAVFKFVGPTIVTSATGSDFTQFKTHFGDDERAFGYIRVTTGDEMSKRAKFLFVTWVGPSVNVLQRAKMSTDKSLMKDILSNFAVELQTENISDINLQNFETELDKAAGAHYGTGVRG